MKKSWILMGGLGLMAFILVACGVEVVEDSPNTECTPTLSSGLDQPTEHQVDFPLSLGNTWVYSGTFYQGFDQTTVLTATYTVTERVVDVLHSELGPYAVFQLARYEELISCPEEWQEMSENWCSNLASEEPEYYWYAIDGGTIYQQQRLEIYRLPERGTIEFVFPLAEGERWYLNVEMAEANPNYETDSMLRKIEQTGPREVPAGNFEECFRLAETIGGNESAMWYCTGVGIVERATDHRGTPSGEREVLVGYVFPE